MSVRGLSEFPYSFDSVRVTVKLLILVPVCKLTNTESDAFSGRVV